MKCYLLIVVSQSRSMRVSYFYAKKLTRKQSNTLDAKIQRINDSGDGYYNKEIAFHDACTDFSVFESQYLRYDSAKGKWDALDVIASCYLTYRSKLTSYYSDKLEMISW